MRLSEAIMLGSVQVHPTRGFFLRRDPDGSLSGCALGMAVFAVSDDARHRIRVMGTDAAADRWPWILRAYRLPCRCYNYADVRSIIMHVFDLHVKTDGTWTLERLVDWIRACENEIGESADAVPTQPVQTPQVQEMVLCGQPR